MLVFCDLHSFIVPRVLRLSKRWVETADFQDSARSEFFRP
jgi:hypothetical protein